MGQSGGNPLVTLRPMSPDVWRTWRDAAILSYASEKIRAGTWNAEDATERAVEEFASLLPDGEDTVGHEFRSVVNDAGKTVGSVWIAPHREVGHGNAFIYDIVIDADQRGRGYGRAAMEALEPLARGLGYDRIRLHVFGHNAVARSLYASLGYVETDVLMEKRLD